MLGSEIVLSVGLLPKSWLPDSFRPIYVSSLACSLLSLLSLFIVEEKPNFNFCCNRARK